MLPSRVFNTVAANDVSDRVTASFPRLLIPDDVRAVFASAANPVKVLTVAAFTAPVVVPSRVLRAEAATEVSLMVTASFPNPLIPDDA